ncbi:Uncharacterised protein [uncultured archaeon]|nr:Uncharacterised protein [uncultured archaeon]
MDKKENLISLARELDSLGLDNNQKRAVLKKGYNCFGKMFGYDRVIKEGVEEAFIEGMYGNEAFEYLSGRIEKYDKEIIDRVSYTN